MSQQPPLSTTFFDKELLLRSDPSNIEDVIEKSDNNGNSSDIDDDNFHKEILKESNSKSLKKRMGLPKRAKKEVL